MEILDISWPISATMTHYKNTNYVALEKIIKANSDALEHMISLHSHTGTHIDAPLHFIKNGKSIDQITLKHFIGPCRVLDLSALKTVITAADLEKYTLKHDEIILLKTKNSNHKFDEPFDANFVYVDQTAARYLADCRIRTIGIDYLGIERNQPNHETHKILLRAGIPIIEGLRLAQIKAGNYIFCCLPLFLMSADAAPARAVLLRI